MDATSNFCRILGAGTCGTSALVPRHGTLIWTVHPSNKGQTEEAERQANEAPSAAFGHVARCCEVGADPRCHFLPARGTGFFWSDWAWWTFQDLPCFTSHFVAPRRRSAASLRAVRALIPPVSAFPHGNTAMAAMRALSRLEPHTFKRTRHGKQPRQFLQTPRILARHAPAASFASAQFKASTQISVVPLWSSMISCDSTMVSFTVLHCFARGLHQRRCRRNRATIEHANVYERFGEGGPVPYAESKCCKQKSAGLPGFHPGCDNGSCHALSKWM